MFINKLWIALVFSFAHLASEFSYLCISAFFFVRPNKFLINCMQMQL